MHVFGRQSKSASPPIVPPEAAAAAAIAAVVSDDVPSPPRPKAHSPPSKVQTSVAAGKKEMDTTVLKMDSSLATKQPAQTYRKTQGGLLGRIRSRTRSKNTKEFCRYSDLAELRESLFTGSKLSSREQKQLLKALDETTTPVMFQTVLQEYEDALLNLYMPKSLDSQEVDVQQAIKDIEREFVLINGQSVDFSSTQNEGMPLSTRGRESSIGWRTHVEHPLDSSSGTTSKGDYGVRAKLLLEALAREVRRFPRARSADTPGDTEMVRDDDSSRGEEIDEYTLVSGVTAQELIWKVCAAMSRTGFGGDSHSAVQSLVGHTTKLIRPVVKPNLGMNTGGDSHSTTFLSKTPGGFDASDPLPIHVEFLPEASRVHLTTSSVFDIHLAAHLASPEKYLLTDDFVTPLGRVVAVCHESIDVSTNPPTHTRRLNVTLMDSPEPPILSVAPEVEAEKPTEKRGWRQSQLCTERKAWRLSQVSIQGAVNGEDEDAQSRQSAWRHSQIFSYHDSLKIDNEMKEGAPPNIETADFVVSKAGDAGETTSTGQKQIIVTKLEVQERASANRFSDDESDISDEDALR